MRTWTTTHLAVIVGAAALLGGCAGTDAATPPPAARASQATREPPLTSVAGAYLGRAGDSDVLVAVVPGDDHTVRVYACDGKELANATVDQWFQGAFDGTGPVTLSAGAYKMTLRKANGAFSGEFFKDGKALPFVATLPTDGSALLDAELRDPKTGAVTRDGNVIVLGGEQRGNLVPTRPPKCRVVLVASGSGATYIVLCG